MSGVDVLLAVVGCAVTALTIIGMVLMTPRGGVDLFGDERESQGVELSRADAQRPADVARSNGRADRAVADPR